MTKQKYIGIENELKSFYNNKIVPFNMTGLRKIVRNTKYIENTDYELMWSEVNNLYYIDGCEIEIATPPIPLNKGFATRVTNSLIIGRNQIIKNTPHMKHTGYSMHWNLTRPAYNRTNIYGEGIAIPFQLFGLTPTSCGFNIQQKSSGTRFEIAGDSLTNKDQIQATALLLGAYNLAKEEHDFPIIIPQVSNSLKSGRSIQHMLKLGRDTIVNTYEKFPLSKNQINYFPEITSQKETSVQNILELFYQWLSPFVYKLGEREEINNLEAFVKGEKKLEIDDIKYFYMLEKKGEEFVNEYTGENSYRYDSKVYRPVNIQTPHNKRSPVLKLNNKAKIPIEGQLWQKIMNTKGIKITYKSEDWDGLKILLNKKLREAYSIDEIYELLESVSQTKYNKSLDCLNIKPNTITQEQYTKIINKQTQFNTDKDTSAIIPEINRAQFEEYIDNLNIIYGYSK